ncbi:MAG TPA: TIGR03087 family PEP-CTERM/XrtA system glycosyltransferase [Woeseiaceae bacterium]|nr:TIGR03087 family PEP-CTERM/XrtA system glycosyltransferase [Woeseiaceae bacterium]
MCKPELIYLVHRIPYPPDKGDKIRSHHILRYLLRKYRVHLGCFVDTPSDMQHVAALQCQCASVFARPLPPLQARLKSLSAFLRGEALTLRYYRDRAMRHWVHKTIENNNIQAAMVFSSPMAQFLIGSHGAALPRVMDFVDVDSDKWRQYAHGKRGLGKWVYAREAGKLLDYERRVARDFDASVFVSPNETNLFTQLSPETRDRHYSLGNGVAYGYFDPEIPQSNPFGGVTEALVFTGMMNYWPNVDAVNWFARDVLPAIVQRRPNAEFWIVGDAPVRQVLDLARLPGVRVTGRVPDVRPYLRHARTIVAPLRIARGIQNKVLEALSMGKPVVCTPQAAAGLDRLPEAAVAVAGDGVAFASRVVESLDRDQHQVCKVARSFIIDHYDWDRNLERLDALLAPPQGNAAVG